jgi:hypothetical protein
MVGMPEQVVEELGRLNEAGMGRAAAMTADPGEDAGGCSCWS